MTDKIKVSRKLNILEADPQPGVPFHVPPHVVTVESVQLSERGAWVHGVNQDARPMEIWVTRPSMVIGSHLPR